MRALLLVGCIAFGQDANWTTYSGNFQGHRYSPLQQITKANVSKLKPLWVYQIDRTDKFEATPIVRDGLMFLSEPPSDVTALETGTGKVVWKYRRVLPDTLPVCCGKVNRGVALDGDRVFIGTLDAHLVALDASTGHVIWDATVAEYKKGYTSTAAPLVVKDLVIIGSAGGEFGVRGYLAAYDKNTGKEVWRTWTVPAVGEKGSETWKGESYKTGSATTWGNGSYDAALNTLYWGTGNPGPDWNGASRLGDNLYSNSLLALDASTGKMKWYFQFTPHDVHDWDSTQLPVLVDLPWKGRMRKLVLFANRNAFYYVLDRETGEYLLGKQYVKQSWAEGLDEKGRPVRIDDMEPSPGGKVVYPNSTGATNFQAPSYSPSTKLHYVMTQDQGGVFYSGDSAYKEGSWFLAGRFIPRPLSPAGGGILAMDPITGNAKWDFRLIAPSWSGILSTAGGLVFSATADGDVLALDDATGKLLWKFPAGGKGFASPVSYLHNGKQQVAIAIGHSLYVFGL